MSQKESSFVKFVTDYENIKNKENWGPGPWENEPVQQHIEEYQGHFLVCSRNSLGAWCGYINIPSNSKYVVEDEFDSELEIHGGITWSQARLPFPTGNPEIDEKEWFWLGFDCAHYNDDTPVNEHLRKFSDQLMIDIGKPELNEEMNMATKTLLSRTYKTLNFVIKELKNLVDQVEKGNNENKN
jgi:hypothetical protein